MIFLENLKDHEEVVKKMEILNENFKIASGKIINTLKNGGRILICGNGGSAADAQHFAAELTGRYKTERTPLAGIALSTDTSALTAIGNDYGFDEVFARQTKALGRKGDILIGISTSGNSKNIIKAFEVAKDLGMETIALSGKNGGKMKEICPLNLIIPSDNTPRIQEMHILLIHSLCEGVDKAWE